MQNKSEEAAMQRKSLKRRRRLFKAKSRHARVARAKAAVAHFNIMGRTSARATKALADESVIIDDTQSHEASMRVTFEGGGASTAGSRPTTTASAIAPLADCIDVSIGVTNVTRWKVTDYLRPPGLGLKNSGLDPKLADSVYSAACRGDAEAISKLLGGGEKAGEEGADPKLAAAEDAEPAENTPEPGWKIVAA